MLYTNISKSVSKPIPVLNEGGARVAGPMPVPNREVRAASERISRAALAELAVITSRRCSSFFAEAAVLVLVFGILDLLLLKGHVDVAWIAGALAISVGLLGASIATDFTAQRWVKAFP